MTIHQMRIFHKIVENQGFAAAGEQLLLSQPSVSAQLKSFEKSLGLTLIDRQQSIQTNGIVLTEEGRFVFESTQRILDEWDKLLEYSTNRTNKNRIIKIVTNSPIGSYLLPQLLSSYYTINPYVKIKLLMETDYNSLTKLAKSKSYDLCITPKFANILPYVNVIHSFKVPIVLVTAKHDTSSNNEFLLKNINSLPLILPPFNSMVREVLKIFFNELSLQVNGSIELEHSESVKRVLLTNCTYFALLSSITVSNEVKTGSLSVIHTNPPLPQTDYIIFNRKGMLPQKHVNNFVEYLINFLSQNLMGE